MRDFTSDVLPNTEIKRRVQDIYAEFVSDVNPVPMSDWLIQEKVISIDQWQKIKGSDKTNPDICRSLLNHLLDLSNPKAFLVVREALVKQNHWLLQKIDHHQCTCKLAGTLDRKCSSKHCNYSRPIYFYNPRN